MTWLGGNDCVPIACRSNDRTMTIRVKLVVKTNNDGATVNTVSNNKIDSVALSPTDSSSGGASDRSNGTALLAFCRIEIGLVTSNLTDFDSCGDA